MFQTDCTMDQSTIFGFIYLCFLIVSFVIYIYSRYKRLVAIRKDQSRHLIYSPCFFTALKCSSNSPRPEFLYIYCIHLLKELNRAPRADLLNFTHFALQVCILTSKYGTLTQQNVWKVQDPCHFNCGHAVLNSNNNGQQQEAAACNLPKTGI